MQGQSWEVATAAGALTPEADPAVGGDRTPVHSRRRQREPQEVAAVASALAPKVDSGTSDGLAPYPHAVGA